MAARMVNRDMVSACCASPSTNSSHQQFLTRFVCSSVLVVEKQATIVRSGETGKSTSINHCSSKITGDLRSPITGGHLVGYNCL